MERLKSILEAIEKVAVFSKFEKTLSKKDLEKLILRNFKDAIPGSVVIDTKAKASDTLGGSAHVNFKMKTETGERQGSVSVRLEPTKNSVRVIAFVNIDS